MRLSFILILTILIAGFVTVSATIINIPDDYPTIQHGINASSDGDTVLVQPGTYVENINFNGHSIMLGSLFLTTGDTFYTSQTIIDGDSSGSVVTFESQEDITAVITGFTLQNGLANYGGGIYCYESSPTISNNTISGNSANYTGGGILCHWSSPTISNNTITGNSADWYGGGIECFISNPFISNNTITGNSADDGGGIDCDNSNSTISNNTITGNSADDGGGIFFWGSSPTLSNNTITGNSANNFGGGIYCFYSDPVVVNTIFWANIAESDGNEIYLDSTSSISISYSDIQDTLWPGEGNIDIDPLFRDPENGDFHLMAIEYGFPYDSPCIDSGHPEIFDSFLDSLWGLGTERSDMGAYGGDAYQTDIPEITEQFIPNKFILSQNYPNPFNATTTIQYTLPVLSHITIDIYDILGRKVETLINTKQQAGYHYVIWNAKDISTGMYFYKIQAGEHAETRKMLLLK